MIQSIPLGASGQMVSELCLGAMYMGSKINEADSEKVLDTYLSCGGSFIDTANNYAHWVEGCSGTESETFLGKWLRHSGMRQRVFLATKVGFDKKGIGKGLNFKQIMENCENSLRLLQTDHIDLYYAHTDDRATPLEESLEAFARLHQAGKVRHIGASNYTAWRMEKARAISKANTWPSFVCLQERFTYLRPVPGPLDRFHIDMGDDIMDYALEENLTLLAYSPLLQGYYGRRDRALPQMYRGDFNDRRMETLSSVAEEIGGITLNQLVLAWIRRQDAPVIPIISGHSPDQISENIQALTIHLREEQLDRLNKA